MKNWKKASIGALCVAALLAGCGTRGGDTNNDDNSTDEPKEITLEQVRAENCSLAAYSASKSAFAFLSSSRASDRSVSSLMAFVLSVSRFSSHTEISKRRSSSR